LKELAGRAVEQKHPPDIPVAGGGRYFHATSLPIHQRKGDNVRGEPDRADLPARDRADESLELIGRRHIVHRTGGRREQIGAAAIDG